MSHWEDRWDELRAETFLVVGFTDRTGRSAARLFEAHGVPYRISDQRPLDELLPALDGLRIGQDRIHAGPQLPSQLEGVSQLLLSPGVPRQVPLVAEAARRGIPLWTDIDLAYDFIREQTIVAVTGTDGKTTTAALITAILREDRSVVMAGNMGIPVLDKLAEIRASAAVVLELSSFMLEGLRRFRPNVSTVLNLAVDHVDRYPSEAAYRASKLAIVRHSTPDDLFVKNLDDPVLAAFQPGLARAVTVSRHAHRRADYQLGDDTFVVGAERLRYADCRLRGLHNASNALAAVAICAELGVAPRRLLAALREFEPLPHRFQHLGRHDGVLLVDDSKATTVHAVSAALDSLDGPVVLVVGGRDKGLPFAELRRHEPRLRWTVCYGEACDRIAHELGFERSERHGPFDAAVAAAVARARPGDTLLLSPGCTSFDQFPSYEVRGQLFGELARARLEARARKQTR